MIYFSGLPRRPIRQPSSIAQWSSALLFLAWCTSCAQSFAPANSRVSRSTTMTKLMDEPRRWRYLVMCLFERKNDEEEEEEQEVQSSSSNDPVEAQPDDGDRPGLRTSTVRIDDGGSNLTDRFKYKVRWSVFDDTKSMRIHPSCP